MIGALAFANAVLGLALTAANPARAQGTPPGHVPPRPLSAMEQAGFFPGAACPRPDPPSLEAEWQVIQLPDDWSLSRPGAQGVGWYRVEVYLEEPIIGMYGLYVPRVAGSRLTGLVNGAMIGGSRGVNTRARATPFPLSWSIPPALLRPGSNVIHLCLEADARYRDGLTRVYFGGAQEAVLERSRRDWAQGDANRVFGFAAIIAGVAALVVWFRRRSDAIVFWLGVAAIATALGPALLDMSGPRPTTAWLETLMMLCAYAFVPPLLMALLPSRPSGPRGIAIASWALLGLAFVAMLAVGPGAFPQVAPYVALFCVGALLAAVAVCLPTGRPVQDPRYLGPSMLAVAALCAIFLAHDLAIWFGYLDFDRLVAAPLVPATVALVTTLTLLTRHLQAYRGLQRSRSELEQRVAERTRQLEKNFERIREFERTQSALTERQRIVADMHDGLGGTLVRLLSLVKNGGIDRASLAKELEHALIELRLSFDSMEDFDHDLLVLLGAVRHRLGKSLEAAGIEIDWRVEPLPRTGWLTPQRSHHLQRLLLEVFTNAIRHSNATKISVAVERTDTSRVRVLVADNGRGFSTGQESAPGRGLGNVRRRSALLGAQLVLETSPGRGTRVILELPAETLAAAIPDGHLSPTA